MKNILVYEDATNTIRQHPGNYMIAHKKEHLLPWVLDFDSAANKKLVLRVCEALFEHKNRYGTGLELLAAVTSNGEFDTKTNHYICEVQDSINNYRIIQSVYCDCYSNQEALDYFNSHDAINKYIGNFRYQITARQNSIILQYPK
jgi:ferredoxin-thioredoxin reductase catalytic subunit